jgi:hypothetical protein
MDWTLLRVEVFGAHRERAGRDQAHAAGGGPMSGEWRPGRRASAAASQTCASSSRAAVTSAGRCPGRPRLQRRQVRSGRAP